jgi:two-component system sensor histidine kinase VanS
MSVRLKLTLSYAVFLMAAGAMLLTVVWVFLLRGGLEGVLSFHPSDFTRALDPNNFGPRVFGAAAALVMMFLLIFGLVGGWILAGRMLAPLSRVTEATRLASRGSLSHRISLEGRQDEFRELADSFDAMLAQLEAHVAEQQRFAANASHELRTPLAVAQTLLEVARDDPNREPSELVDRLHAVNTHAIGVTEALLLLSRADQGSFTQERVDLSLVAEEAIERLLPLAEERGVTIETSGDTAITIGSYALLVQMATNLVHNAIIHNLAEHGSIWITTSTDLTFAKLEIENTGHKLSPQMATTLTEPFQRGRERVHGDRAGVGLGLSIVKSITQAHYGRLTITPRSGGGLRVTAQLPTTPPGESNGTPDNQRQRLHSRRS